MTNTTRNDILHWVGCVRWRAMWLVMAVALPACGDITEPEIEPPRPLFIINPDDPCNIYEPCLLGTIWVVVRRQPDDPVQWANGKACSQLAGGCIPLEPERPPILGPEPHWNQGGSQELYAVGFAQLVTRPAKQAGLKGGQILAAINEIDYFDEDDVCQPIIDNLKERYQSGRILVADFVQGPTYASGEWRGDEIGGGTIYINTMHSNWDENGVVDDRVLRKTMTEEGIHAWFDTDAQHAGATEERLAAMNKMRVACGLWE